LHKQPTSPSDKPVYEVILHPGDGLYPLPYMARQADGSAWEMDGTEKNAPAELVRVPFFPDGSRLFEEIDRLGVSDQGVGCLLTSKAEFDFYRGLNLLIDTAVPICGNSSQRPHGALANDGDRNIVDSVEYITSRIWADENGKDCVGAVAILDEIIFTSRDVQKADARPGGYIATGGHGGIIGRMGHPGAPQFSFKPVRRHTSCSELRLTKLPSEIEGSHLQGSQVRTIAVQIKDAQDYLLGAAIPKVTIVKHARYLPEDTSGDPSSEVDILARIENNLRDAPLAGFIAEGSAPFGAMSNSVDAALKRATFSGMPVVKVGRGNAGGFVDPTRDPLAIAGSNLTATKARLLLMACLMKLGCLPPAGDPANPTAAEIEATKAKLKEYQEIFDTH
jgi:L-asparaginase